MTTDYCIMSMGKALAFADYLEQSRSGEGFATAKDAHAELVARGFELTDLPIALRYVHGNQRATIVKRVDGKFALAFGLL